MTPSRALHAASRTIPAPAGLEMRWRLPRWLAGLAVGASILAIAGDAATQARNPLFERTMNPAIISQQVQLALPSALRGLELLASGSSDSAALNQAMDSIDDTYKYLRAAQESSELLNSHSKYPDPLRPVQMGRMWQVRLQLLECLKERGHIVQQNPETISMCSQHLKEGIRQLRVLLAIMP